MLLSPNWEESSSLCLPEAFQSLKGLYPTMIPVSVVLVSPSDESLDCGWGSLHSLQ